MVSGHPAPSGDWQPSAGYRSAEPGSTSSQTCNMVGVSLKLDRGLPTYWAPTTSHLIDCSALSNEIYHSSQRRLHISS